MRALHKLLLSLTLASANIPLAAHSSEQLATLGMRNLAAYSPQEQESHLHLLISEHPGNMALHFHLGNLLAGQQRWAAARTAYARAAELSIEHPDIHYNLAIALDHLGQSTQAARHYRMALRAAKNRPHLFHPTTAEQRLREIGASAS